VEIVLDVIRIPMGMVSAFLVRGDRIILVDTGVPSTVKRIRKVMDANGIKPSDVSLIILTHGHADHAGGAGAAKELTGARIAMHKDCASLLRQGKLPEAKPRTLMAWVLDKLFGRMVKVAPVEPDIIIEDELDLRPFGVKGKVISTPGHTIGCVSVLLDNSQALVGDLLMGKNKGLKAALPLFLRDLAKLKKSLARVLEAGPVLIHNAHGPACTLEACRKLADSIRADVK
jgi:hydroxyacylglutathione hydrolase